MQRKSLKFSVNEDERGMIKRIAEDLLVTEAQAIRLSIAILCRNLDNVAYNKMVKVLLKRKRLQGQTVYIECTAEILSCFSLVNEKMHQAFEALLSKGLDLDTAVKLLKIKLSSAKKLIKQSGDYDVINKPPLFYDHMLVHDDFLEACQKLMKSGKEDVYFSLNSFYKPEKAGRNVRHINGFVSDFDFYKMDQYKWLEPAEFYSRYIKKKLSVTPTAVLDSRRELYVVYTFQHCSYHIDKLYQSIMKAFYTSFKNYGIDAGAMLITQVIRLPWTINSKTNTEVTILEFNDTSSLSDILKILIYKFPVALASSKNKCIKSYRVKNDICISLLNGNTYFCIMISVDIMTLQKSNHYKIQCSSRLFFQIVLHMTS